MEQVETEWLWACVGRRNDYAVQQRDGRYLRAFRPLTDIVLARHLAGRVTLGTYVCNEEGRCPFAVFDADQPGGLRTLVELQAELAGQGFPAYLERSRRGGHLWLFFQEPYSAEHVRSWLLPLALPRRLELFPKQSAGRGVGSLIRLPLGIHKRSGRRYPFLTADLHPVAPTLSAQLQWLGRTERVVPPTQPLPVASPPPTNIDVDVSMPSRSIHDWNVAQNPFILIGRYVRLNRSGSGCCPFGEHHEGGRDTRASFRVFYPQRPGGVCWYCYAWEQGGNAFDFLCHYHRLDARTLWHRILDGDLP